MARGFEIVNDYKDKNINLPIRKTKYSAGYDIEAAEDIIIPPFKKGIKPTLIPTGLKAYFENDEFLMLVNRSSGPKKGLILPNSIGIIDSDYYNNETNEGHFYFQFYNVTDKELIIKKGDVIGQAIFQKFLLTDNDYSDGIRTSGFGSTDKNS
ncbi:MAG: dUTP diphosphatase [Acholeplasma sp.]|nr:dUTP diphosphatase [Acholeplasma sp.]